MWTGPPFTPAMRARSASAFTATFARRSAEEVGHALAPARHAHLERVGRPGVVAEQGGHLAARRQRPFEHVHVGRAALHLLLREQLASQLRRARLAHEGEVLRVVEGDAVARFAVRLLRPQRLDEGLGQAVQRLARRHDAVVPLVDVLLEGDAQRDELVAERPHARAFARGQPEAVAAVVAQLVVEQARLIGGQRLAPRRVRADGGVQVLAEGELDEILVDALFLAAGGLAQGGVAGHVGHEGVLPGGLRNPVGGLLERAQRVGEGTLAVGRGHDGVHGVVAGGDGAVAGGVHVRRRQRREIGQSGIDVGHGATLRDAPASRLPRPSRRGSRALRGGPPAGRRCACQYWLRAGY